MKNTTRNILIGFALAVGVLALLAAVPSQTDFDGTYFKTNTLPISLIGNLVNWQQRTTNSFSSHWVDSGTSDATLAGTAIAAAFRDTNNVLSYGADPTGVSDSTLALSNAFKRTIVYIPAGTYLTGPLYPTNNAIITGDGVLSRLVLASPGLNSLINCVTNQVTLSHLSLDGGTNLAFNINSWGNNTTGLIHYATGEGAVENLHISGFTFGLRVDGPNDIAGRKGTAIYRNNFITNCNVGIGLSANNAAEYTIVANNQIRGVWIGIYNQSGGNVNITGNTLHDGDIGMYPSSANRGHSLYTGNIVNHFKNPIYAYKADNALFIGNHFLGGGSSGLYLASCTNCTISECELETLNNAITLVGGSTNIIRNNVVVASGSTALVGNDPTNSFFSGNRSVDTGPIWGSIAVDKSGNLGIATNAPSEALEVLGNIKASAFIVAGTTNQVIFGATNTAPVSSAAPTKWISVQVSGEATVYRLPLYE